MTVLEVIRSAADYLGKHGVESPRLNAEHLLARALGVKRLELYLWFDRPVSESEREPLRDWVRRRAKGEPLQHILGEWDFFGRPFAVDKRALVPRPETELLIEQARALFPRHTPPNNPPPLAIDVGTGSGILAVTMALEWPDWKIAATDASPDALALARQNAQRHAVENRITWFCCDVLPPPAELHGASLLISNPPYIPTADLPSLPREVLHDPIPALDGGHDGLRVIREIIRRAPEVLAPGGWLLMEIGFGQADAVLELLREPLWQNTRATPDYNGIPRVVAARKGEL